MTGRETFCYSHRMHRSLQETIFFYTVAGLSLIAAAIFLGPYLPVIAFAVLLGILFYPMYHRLLLWTGKRNWLALPLSFGGILITFVLPFAIVGIISYRVIVDFVRHFGSSNLGNTVSLSWVVDRVNQLLAHLPGTSYTLTVGQVSDQLHRAAVSLGSRWVGSLQDVGQAVLSLMPAIVVAVYLISAIFVNYRAIGRFLHRLSPLNDTIDRLYLERIKGMGLSMVRGTFVVALVQGVIAGLLFWISGVGYAAFLGLLAVVLSVLPLGAGVLMVPVGIFLLVTGQVWQGAVLLLGCFFIIANVDNVLRPRLVSKEAGLLPALTILGLLAGLLHFGFLGVIYGPVLMIFFATTVEVYMSFFRPKDEE